MVFFFLSDSFSLVCVLSVTELNGKGFIRAPHMSSFHSLSGIMLFPLMLQTDPSTAGKGKENITEKPQMPLGWRV